MDIPYFQIHLSTEKQDGLLQWFRSIWSPFIQMGCNGTNLTANHAFLVVVSGRIWAARNTMNPLATMENLTFSAGCCIFKRCTHQQIKTISKNSRIQDNLRIYDDLSSIKQNKTGILNDIYKIMISPAPGGIMAPGDNFQSFSTPV